MVYDRHLFIVRVYPFKLSVSWAYRVKSVLFGRSPDLLTPESFLDLFKLELLLLRYPRPVHLLHILSILLHFPVQFLLLFLHLILLQLMQLLLRLIHWGPVLQHLQMVPLVLQALLPVPPDLLILLRLYLLILLSMFHQLSMLNRLVKVPQVLQLLLLHLQHWELNLILISLLILLIEGLCRHDLLYLDLCLILVSLPFVLFLLDPS